MSYFDRDTYTEYGWRVIANTPDKGEIIWRGRNYSLEDAEFNYPGLTKRGFELVCRDITIEVSDTYTIHIGETDAG